MDRAADRRGVGAAHKKSMVRRDLKPTNFKITRIVRCASSEHGGSRRPKQAYPGDDSSDNLHDEITS
jgi:hypothetical protein